MRNAVYLFYLYLFFPLILYNSKETMSVKFQICSCAKCNAPTNLTYVSAKVVVAIGLISECTMLLGNNYKWHQMHFYKKYNQNTE